MSSSSITPCIQPNPDISGIGVRVSIYAQALLSLVPLLIFAMDGEITIEESLAINDIVMTNELTACALLVSAIIQARTYGLSTYHANIVLVLTWITFVPCMATAYFGPARGRKLTDRDATEADRKYMARIAWKFRLRGLVIWLHYIAVAALGIWVWSDVKSFGNQPQCTPYTFVLIFGYDILVTNQGLRGVALYLYGSIALSAALIPVYIPFLQYRLRRRAALHNNGPESSDTNPYAQSRRQKRNKKTWITILLVALGVEILLVASTEVLITRSKGLVFAGESQWTFGQSLAVFLVLIPLVSTIGQLQKGYDELCEKREKGESRNRQVGYNDNES